MFGTLRYDFSMGTTVVMSLLAISLASCASASARHGARASTSGDRSIYVHCSAGSDVNPGSPGAPLRTVEAATATAQRAGTTIYLARGCKWDGALFLRGAGTPNAAVAISAYGMGASPVLSGRSLKHNEAVVTMTGSYQKVTGLTIQGAAGLGVVVAGSHGIVENTEITDVGIGVRFAGPFGMARSVAVHDLHMVVSTPGGDDDYGAVGFDVQAPDVEILNSRCTNCRAPSQDYGHDGGFVEIWNYGDRLWVHDNVGYNTSGVLEVGGDRPDGSAEDVVISSNRFYGAHGGIWIHQHDRFAIPLTSVDVSDNTIATWSPDVEILGGNVGVVRLRANVLQTSGYVSKTGPPRSHSCNTYIVQERRFVGYRPESTEQVANATQVAAAQSERCP